MGRTILKNRAGAPLDLDGGHVIVKSASGADHNLEDELSSLRSTMSGLVAAADALRFKGVINASTPLPNENYQVGWTYKVGAAGIYAGEKCEVGDMVICIRDYSAASFSDMDWQVLQTNIDGAVTGPAAATDGNLAAFNGVTGKIIGDSSVKAADAIDAIAKKHGHANMDVLVSLGKDEDGNLTLSGNTVGGDGLLDCVVINAGDAIPANLRDNGIVFEIQADQ